MEHQNVIMQFFTFMMKKSVCILIWNMEFHFYSLRSDIFQAFVYFYYFLKTNSLFEMDKNV